MAVPSDLIVSVSGIRGIVGAGLTPSRRALRRGVRFHRRGKRRDFRATADRAVRCSDTLSSRAYSAAGCTVEDIGITPTPTCGCAVRQLNAAGGIQITASHNPAPWNGLKMFGADGAVISADRGAEIRALYESGNFPRAGWDGTGTIRVPPDVGTDHLRSVLDTVSVATVAGQRFRVFLDANAGAGGPLGTRLLSDLGCDTIQYGCEPTGLFAARTRTDSREPRRRRPVGSAARVCGRLRPRPGRGPPRPHRRNRHLRERGVYTRGSR